MRIFVLPLLVSLAGCTLLFEPHENASKDAGNTDGAEDCGVFANLQSDFTGGLPIPPWQIADAEPLLVGSSADLQPYDARKRGMRTQVANGTGSLTLRLGPHESESLLLISVDGIQFHRNISNRGVYFFDEDDNSTTTIEPGGPYQDGSQELQLTIRVWPELDEDAGTNLAVQYILADAEGQDDFAFAPVRTHVSGEPTILVQGTQEGDDVPILLHEMSCH